MRSRSGWRANLIPWLGTVGAVLGWGLSHQISSNTLFDDCTVGGGFVLLVCGLALVVTIAGGICSFGVWNRGEAEEQARRFIGLLSVLLAALAGFAILLQAASALILPSCAA